MLRTCSGRDCEMSQFWQNLQLTLQPAVATENASDPGEKWNKGFFDGIDVRGAHARMHQRVVAASAILAYSAVAPLLIVDHAFAGTQLAPRFPVRQLLVKLGLDDKPRILRGRRAGTQGKAGPSRHTRTHASREAGNAGELQKRSAIVFRCSKAVQRCKHGVRRQGVVGVLLAAKVVRRKTFLAFAHMGCSRHNTYLAQVQTSTCSIWFGSFVPKR